MTTVNPSAIAMAVFGFLFLFGTLAIALRIAFKSGGYGEGTDDQQADGPSDDAP